MPSGNHLEILILAPTGQDASLIAQALSREEIECEIFSGVKELCEKARAFAGALLISEEALTPSAVSLLNEVLINQPPWSDLPLIVMTSTGDSTLASLRILRAFSPAGNVSLLERPFRSLTLVSVVQVALRARKKQYQVRDLLDEQVKATRIRDEFISIASHELKTPLTALKLQGQLTKMQSKDGAKPLSQERVSKFLNLTNNQVDRLTRLVEDMLDVSRIGSQKLLLEKTYFGIPELAEDIVDRLSSQLEEAGCSVSVKVSGSPHGSWDRYRIEQILYNLLTNAIRYAPGKPIEVEIFEENSAAVLRVTDHGIGIAPGDHEKIFKRFERAVASRNISGLGLGLYICRQIAEAHGGSIMVKNVPGKGASFELRLPASQDSASTG